MEPKEVLEDESRRISIKIATQLRSFFRIYEFDYFLFFIFKDYMLEKKTEFLRMKEKESDR